MQLKGVDRFKIVSIDTESVSIETDSASIETVSLFPNVSMFSKLFFLECPRLECPRRPNDLRQEVARNQIHNLHRGLHAAGFVQRATGCGVSAAARVEARGLEILLFPGSEPRAYKTFGYGFRGHFSFCCWGTKTAGKNKTAMTLAARSNCTQHAASATAGDGGEVWCWYDGPRCPKPATGSQSGGRQAVAIIGAHAALLGTTTCPPLPPTPPGIVSCSSDY